MLTDILICLRLARMYHKLGSSPLQALRRAIRFVWSRP